MDFSGAARSAALFKTQRARPEKRGGGFWRMFKNKIFQT